MNLRTALRHLSRLLTVCRVADRTPARPVGRLALLSCNDLDRSMTREGRRFSPILEGIRELVEPLGYVTLNLTHPYAVFDADQVERGTLTLNRKALALRMRTVWLHMTAPARAKALRIDLETMLYWNLLHALQPLIVFSIQPPWAMCRAARQLGIPVVEAMHGSNISVNDRIFREHMAHADELLPNYILGFDDVTHATYTTFCSGRNIVAVRANDPWIHACRQRSLHRGDARARECARRVLLTLQWGYDGERATLSGIVPNGIIHPALEQAMADTARQGIGWLVRLHPVQINAPGYRHHRRYIESLSARYPNVEVERASNEPLPLLLEEVRGHLTMSSSAVGEASALGIPSLMLCPTLQPGGAHDGFFRELEAAGKVTFGTLDAAAIVSWISRLAPAQRQAPARDIESDHRAELGFYSELIDRARNTRRGPSHAAAAAGWGDRAPGGAT